MPPRTLLCYTRLMTNSDEVRRLVEDYGDSITAKEWADFTELSEGFPNYLDRINGLEPGRPEDDEELEDALDRLLEAYESFKDGRRSMRKKRSTALPDPEPDPRWSALAEILAVRARSDPDVVSFRRDVLQDQLIDISDVTNWIRKTAAADGPPTRFVADHLPEKVNRAREVIRYVSSFEGGQVQITPIRIGGDLWELRMVARRLAHGFSWPEEWTVPFVLTDQAPERPMIFGYTIHESSSSSATMAWVELRLNPYAVSPRALENVYREIRSESFGIKRIDSLSEKTAALAVHWETKPKGQSIHETRLNWNRRYPTWKYPKSARNFGRDARAAHAQVTGEGTH